MPRNQKKQSIFRFRQFSIDQQHCAMKVGTDGVLLGAWAGRKAPARILDIGTGTGLVSCMLAQRFPAAEVHAIDIDEHAFEQALINSAASPFGKRVQVFHASLQEWAKAGWHRYDLIVCNPPYFKNGWPVEDPLRKKARDAAFLPLEEIFSRTCDLITPDGKLALILPATHEQEVNLLSTACGWHAHDQLQVCTRSGKPVERILMEWGRREETLVVKSLLMQDESGFTVDYIDLAAAFYLKMH